MYQDTIKFLLLVPPLSPLPPLTTITFFFSGMINVCEFIGQVQAIISRATGFSDLEMSSQLVICQCQIDTGQKILLKK